MRNVSVGKMQEKNVDQKEKKEEERVAFFSTSRQDKGERLETEREVIRSCNETHSGPVHALVMRTSRESSWEHACVMYRKPVILLSHVSPP